MNDQDKAIQDYLHAAIGEGVRDFNEVLRSQVTQNACSSWLGVRLDQLTPDGWAEFKRFADPQNINDWSDLDAEHARLWEAQQ